MTPRDTLRDTVARMGERKRCAALYWRDGWRRCGKRASAGPYCVDHAPKQSEKEVSNAS